MRTNPSRSGRGKRQAATYWRRRFTALVICLAILAVIAWASQGALGLHLTGATASAGSNSGAHGSHPATAPAGTAGPAGPSTGDSPSASPSASPSPSDSTASHRHGKKPAADGKPGPCAGKEVVLSLFASQHSFPSQHSSSSQHGAGPHALPQFVVDVVSTSAATCKFNVGPKHLALVISIPSGPIWSSADCVKGHGSLVTDLHRGVPVTLPITWNRHRSAPGCTGTTPRVPAGRYSATAIDGQLTSNTERVRLR
jgi:hypothetical protein